MKKQFLFIFLLASGLSVAQSPVFDWAKSFGEASYDEGYSVAVDANGNVYTVGRFNDTVDFDPGPGTYFLSVVAYSDVFVSKLDSAGNFIWAKTVGGALNDIAYGVALDVSGNVCITGSFQGTVDFNPGAGVYNLSSIASSDDIFVLKLDSFGNFLWAKRIGANLYEYGTSISVDMSSNIYVTGHFRGIVDFDPGAGTYNLTSTSSGFNDVFILKLNSSGNFSWARKVGGTGADDGSGIAADALGSVYVTGYYNGTADFDPGAGSFLLTSTGSYEAFVLKLDVSGNFAWANSFGGINFDWGFGLTVDAMSNVYITGHSIGTVDFDPGPGTFYLTSSGTPYCFVLKLDSADNLVWAKNMVGSGGAIGRSIAVDVSQNVYISGTFSKTIDFDPGAGVYNLTYDSTMVDSSDLFISKLDVSGGFVWAIKAGGTDDDYAQSIALDAEGNIYCTGYYGGVVDFDPSAATYNLSGAVDVFVLKYSQIEDVWPGDADNNHVADNSDLLPIGIFYGQTGPPRSAISNAWQAYNAADWGVLQASGADIKHIDCNGDGTIDNNDTLAVNLNFALTHAFAPANNEVRLPVADLHFVTSSSSYLSGNIVDVEVWAGDATTPVTNLYGLAFDINYDASLVQPASESLTYPTSWLGTPGTDAITIAKIDALANTAYGAETRINHTNASGFGKIADFKFQLKTSIPANTVMYFSVSGYAANDATGFPILFNTPLDSIVINPTSVSVSEIDNETQISIYPNPTNGSFNIFTSQQIQNGSIEIYNVIGELVFSQKIINQQNTIDLKNQASGLYFVKVISDGEVIGMKKIIKQ